MNPPDILALTAEYPDEEVDDGVTLIVDGTRGQPLFILVAGELEVQRRGRAVVRISDPGAIVGELGFLLDSPASADVVTLGPNTVRRVDDPARLFDLSPDFGRFLATMLARRLLQVSTYLSDIQEQFADKGEVLGLVPKVLKELLGSALPSTDPGSERETESPY